MMLVLKKDESEFSFVGDMTTTTITALERKGSDANIHTFKEGICSS